MIYVGFSKHLFTHFLAASVISDKKCDYFVTFYNVLQVLYELYQRLGHGKNDASLLCIY